MTSVADAIEVMTIVAACHHRTAPRMDDEEVTLATASVWAELFDGYDFSTTELVAAVKNRAKICPDAPEAADIIRVARATRTDRMARGLDEPDPNPYRADYPREHHRGDAKAADDPPEYPRHWGAEERMSAYWYALSTGATPRSTKGWETVSEQLERRAAERDAKLAGGPW